MKKVIFKNRTGFSKNLMMAAIMLLSVSFVACNDDDDNDDDNSQSGYFYYGEHSYLIVKEKKNWQVAAEDAKARGGYLVEIDSEAEQTAVYNAVKATVPATYTEVPDGGGVAYVWLGGLDYYVEGTWMWNGDNKTGEDIMLPMFWMGGKNGTAFGYANWGAGEPDNYTDSDVSPNGQDFAALALEAWPKGNGSLGKAGEWNDIAGTNQLYYVVEFDTKKGDDDNPATEKTDDYSITVQLEEGDSNIASIKALLNDDVLAEASYDQSNDKFTIILPTPKATYLRESTFTNTGKECSLDGLYAYNKSGKEIGEILCGAVTSDRKKIYVGLFYYTNEDFNFTGNEDDIKFSLSCKEGWNIIYVGYDSDSNDMVEAITQKPSGLIWIFSEDSSSASRQTVSKFNYYANGSLSSAPKQSKAIPRAKEIDRLRSAISKKRQIENR